MRLPTNRKAHLGVTSVVTQPKDRLRSLHAVMPIQVVIKYIQKYRRHALSVGTNVYDLGKCSKVIPKFSI